MGTAGNAERKEIEITLNGKRYTIRGLDLKAYGDAENFIRSNHIKAYRDSAKGVDPALVEQTVTTMVRAAYSPEELGECMAAPSMSEYVAYLSLRHNPGVTRASIGKIVDLSNVAKVNGIISALQRGDEAGAEGEDEVENPPALTEPQTQ